MGSELSRILLVEDNLTNQKVALLMLKKLGYQADLANNGSAACKAFEISPYSLILMDCLMPEMDGFEATRRIRNSGELGKNVPIVALTANAFAEDRDKCLAAGMSDYLSKPFTMDQIATKVERWLVSQQNVAAETVSDKTETGSSVTNATADLLRLAEAVKAADTARIEHEMTILQAKAQQLGLPDVTAAMAEVRSAMSRGATAECREAMDKITHAFNSASVSDLVIK